eukprot:TRINITY_DN2339_c0_g1_i3.p1 TRINITY_DN2339_c0_g1~~TRINITY_DN2339_c0_g1_i3.p1  ORF type:complete len:455 (-),score=134.58 TRINITY_DN2339_c0_g1_i3:717-2081(-)
MKKKKKKFKKKRLYNILNMSDFDLETYITLYTGNTKINRLKFIATRSEELKDDAYKLIVQELLNRAKDPDFQNITNIELYCEACKELDMEPNNNFVEQVKNRTSQRLDSLQNELSLSRANIIRESIRIGITDLGDFFTAQGDTETALSWYYQLKDYASSSKNIIDMCRNIVKTFIDEGKFVNITSYCSKALNQKKGVDKTISSQFNAALGLKELEKKKYKIAAKYFTEYVKLNIGDSFSDVILPSDIGIYGGLCALATYDRRDLKNNIISNPEFKHFLDLVPHVRELINDFYDTRYSSCLTAIDKLKDSLSLDIHLHDHLEDLSSLIRNRALKQYCSPFSSADINIMAEAFNTVPEDLEKELSQLIMSGEIQARIDSHNKILYASHTDLRSVTFENSLKIGETYQRDTKAFILRCSLLQNYFVVGANDKSNKNNNDNNNDNGNNNNGNNNMISD